MFDLIAGLVLLVVFGFVGLFWLVGFLTGRKQLPERIQSDVEYDMMKLGAVVDIAHDEWIKSEWRRLIAEGEAAKNKEE